MKTLALTAAALLLATSALAAEANTPRGKAWWADIEAIASDKTEGRLPGSRGYDLAATHVIA